MTVCEQYSLWGWSSLQGASWSVKDHHQHIHLQQLDKLAMVERSFNL